MKELSPPFAEAVEASIATLAQAAGSATRVGSGARRAPGGSGGSYRLHDRTKGLSTGEFLIAVIDEESLTVRKVRASPSPGRRHTAPRGAIAGKLALRLAEIEFVAGKLLGELPASAHTAVPALTEGEENALARGGFDATPLTAEETDPVLRATVKYANLLVDSVSSQEAASILGVNSSRVRQRIAGKPRTLYAIKRGSEWRIPKFQFMKNRLVPGIEKVVASLAPELHAVVVYNWFTTPSPDLPLDDDETRLLSPLEWLKVGNSPDVVAELASDL